MAKFDFNSNGLKEGCKIVNSKGVIIYSVVWAGTPSWETPCPDYENSAMWITVEAIDKERFSQPVQWFNTVIANNEGMRVI